MSSRWDGILPVDGPGADLSAERLDSFLQSCARVVCEARNKDDFGLPAGFMAPDVLEALKRSDQAAATTAASGKVSLAHEQVVLDEVSVEPVGLRIEGVDIVTRVKLDHRARINSGSEPLFWSEFWEVTIPPSATALATARCDVCGGPRMSAGRCEWCKTTILPKALSESFWRVTWRRT